MLLYYFTILGKRYTDVLKKKKSDYLYYSNYRLHEKHMRVLEIKSLFRAKKTYLLKQADIF
jgi:hypothetical protein